MEDIARRVDVPPDDEGQAESACHHQHNEERAPPFIDEPPLHDAKDDRQYDQRPAGVDDSIKVSFAVRVAFRQVVKDQDERHDANCKGQNIGPAPAEEAHPRC